MNGPAIATIRLISVIVSAAASSDAAGNSLVTEAEGIFLKMCSFCLSLYLVGGIVTCNKIKALHHIFCAS